MAKDLKGVEIPATNDKALRHYNTRQWSCNCEDYQKRGGSYIDPVDHDPICKHIYRKRAMILNQRELARVNAPAPHYTPPASTASALVSIWERTTWLELTDSVKQIVTHNRIQDMIGSPA